MSRSFFSAALLLLLLPDDVPVSLFKLKDSAHIVVDVLLNHIKMHFRIAQKLLMLF